MARAFAIPVLILLFAGCERPTVAPFPEGSGLPEQVLVLSGFNPADSVILHPDGYRVGKYHDFSPYDSLLISFHAEQVSPDVPSAHISVKVGPGDYFKDTLLTREKLVAVKVVCADLAKPETSALVFFVTDPNGELLLSRLRVVGWTSVLP